MLQIVLLIVTMTSTYTSRDLQGIGNMDIFLFSYPERNIHEKKKMPEKSPLSGMKQIQTIHRPSWAVFGDTHSLDTAYPGLKSNLSGIIKRT